MDGKWFASYNKMYKDDIFTGDVKNVDHFER